MVQKVMGDYRPIKMPFTGVEGLREEMPLDIEPIESFSLRKLLTLFVKRQTDMLNTILKPVQLVLGQNQSFMIGTYK